MLVGLDEQSLSQMVEKIFGYLHAVLCHLNYKIFYLCVYMYRYLATPHRGFSGPLETDNDKLVKEIS